jgi:hypothetical protein
MIYTGIGSQETPPDVLKKMYSFANLMAKQKHTLRSGGAKGADTAFEEGCDVTIGRKEIYLPRQEFNQNESPLFTVKKEARLLASKFHPCWSNVGDRGRDFMGRNAYQVLGLDLKTPTEFIICWTNHGKIYGGTGQALRMANHYRIPVFNFAGMDDLDMQTEILKILEKE